MKVSDILNKYKSKYKKYTCKHDNCDIIYLDKPYLTQFDVWQCHDCGCIFNIINGKKYILEKMPSYVENYKHGCEQLKLYR